MPFGTTKNRICPQGVASLNQQGAFLAGHDKSDRQLQERLAQRLKDLETAIQNLEGHHDQKLVKPAVHALRRQLRLVGETAWVPKYGKQGTGVQLTTLDADQWHKPDNVADDTNFGYRGLSGHQIWVLIDQETRIGRPFFFSHGSVSLSQVVRVSKPNFPDDGIGLGEENAAPVSQRDRDIEHAIKNLKTHDDASLVAPVIEKLQRQMTNNHHQAHYVQGKLSVVPLGYGSLRNDIDNASETFGYRGLSGEQIMLISGEEQRLKRPFFFKKPNVWLTDVVHLPDMQFTDAITAVDGILEAHIGPGHKVEIDQLIFIMDSAARASPTKEQFLQLRDLPLQLVRHGIPKPVRENIIAVLQKDDPRRTISHTAAWRQWSRSGDKNDRRPLMFTEYEALRCWNLGKEHPEVKINIERFHLEHYRHAILVFNGMSPMDGRGHVLTWSDFRVNVPNPGLLDQHLFALQQTGTLPPLPNNPSANRISAGQAREVVNTQRALEEAQLSLAEKTTSNDDLQRRLQALEQEKADLQAQVQHLTDPGHGEVPKITAEREELRTNNAALVSELQQTRRERDRLRDTYRISKSSVRKLGHQARNAAVIASYAMATYAAYRGSRFLWARKRAAYMATKQWVANRALSLGTYLSSQADNINLQGNAATTGDRLAANTTAAVHRLPQEMTSAGGSMHDTLEASTLHANAEDVAMGGHL
ncbi:hypothetical protein SUNI508_12364 [Seiridium unicorne]|uniref:Uncharacterized protein n=1 Tax=Seiridium unicorne TaxID=138068 RepID=A0ABR2UDQ9_9PEZI